MSDNMEDASFSPWLLIVVLLCVTFVFVQSLSSADKQPPGQGVLQILQNVLFKSRQSPESRLKELSKKYGAVFTVYLGIQKFVAVTGWKAIKAVLNQEDLSDKDCPPIIHDLQLTHGIVFSNGDSMKEMRKFTLTNLKQFGLGKKMSEGRIMEELQYLMEIFEEKKGKAFDTSLPVSLAVSNIICAIIYGQRFEYDDENFREMVEKVGKNSYLLGSPSIQLYNYFPRLYKNIKERAQLMKSSFANRKFVAQLIRQSEESLEPHMCRGLVDAFLLKKKQPTEVDNRNSHYHEDNLIVTNINLLAGGTDSTSSTLRYGLLLMAKYPDVQDQVQEEIDRVVGNLSIRAEYAQSMPYTQAVIHETQRLLSVFPFLFHLSRKDVPFQGYCIKKGTPIIIMMSSALHDENEWEQPHTFNPAHFLDKDGKLRRREAFIPFSDGSRNCVGQSLAKMNLFLFFASLLQRFRFTPPPGVKKEDLDLKRIMGLSCSPSPHLICAIKRI